LRQVGNLSYEGYGFGSSTGWAWSDAFLMTPSPLSSIANGSAFILT
jgi:hypothetical protein